MSAAGGEPFSASRLSLPTNSISLKRTLCDAGVSCTLARSSPCHTNPYQSLRIVIKSINARISISGAVCDVRLGTRISIKGQAGEHQADGNGGWFVIDGGPVKPGGAHTCALSSQLEALACFVRPSFPLLRLSPYRSP